MENEKRAVGILSDLLGRRKLTVEDLHKFTGASIGTCAAALVLARECRQRENREWINGCFDVHLHELSDGFRGGVVRPSVKNREVASQPT